MKRLAVIGGGPAGLAAAIWARRLGLQVTVYEAREALGGELLRLSLPLVDVPGAYGATGADVAARLASHAAAVGATLVTRMTVVGVDAAGALKTAAGPLDPVDAVIVATGTLPRRLGVPGEDALGAPSVSDWIRSGRREPVVVVGGGDRAVEAAVRLAAAGSPTTLIHRRMGWRAQPYWVERLRASPVTVLAPAQVLRARGTVDAGGAVLVKTAAGERWLPAAALFVRIGMDPALPPGLPDPSELPPTIRLVGDAAVPPAYRSVVTAYASAMEAVKAWTLASSPPEGGMPGPAEGQA